MIQNKTASFPFKWPDKNGNSAKLYACKTYTLASRSTALGWNLHFHHVLDQWTADQK